MNVSDHYRNNNNKYYYLLIESYMETWKAFLIIFRFVDQSFAVPYLHFDRQR